MLTKIFIIVVIIHLSNTSILTQTEAGTLSPVSTATPGSTVLTFTYTFRNTYALAPRVIMGIVSMHDCHGSMTHYLRFHKSIIQKTNTIYQWTGQINTQHSYDLSFSMRSSYVVFSTTLTNIQIKQNLQIYTTSFTHTETFSQPFLLHTLTYTQCFLTAIYCVNGASASPFYFTTSCDVTSVDSIKFSFSFSSGGDAAGCGTNKDIGFFYLVIYPNTSYITIYGQIIVTSTTYPKLTNVDSSKIFSTYFIGLTSLKTNDACFHIEFAGNNLQIDPSSSNILRLDYSYFQLSPKAYRSLVTSLPLEGQVEFYFSNLNGFSITTPSTDFSINASFSFVSFVSSTLKTSITAPIPQNQILLNLKFSNSYFEFKMISALTVMFVDQVVVSPFKNSIEVSMLNMHYDSGLHNIQQSITGFVEKSFVKRNNTAFWLDMDYQKSIYGSLFDIKYTAPNNQNFGAVRLIIPTLTQMRTSAISNSSILVIGKLHDPTATTHSNFFLVSTHIANSNSQMIASDTMVQLTFNYMLPVQVENFQIEYFPDPLKFFKMIFKVKLIKVKTIEVTTDSNTCVIVFINIDGLSEPKIQDFSLSNPGLQIVSFQKKNSHTEVSVNYKQEHEGKLFSANFALKDTLMTATTTDLKIVKRFVSSKADIFQHWINITFRNVEGVSILPRIQIMNKGIQIKNIQFSGNDIVVSCIFDRTIDGTFQSLIFDFEGDTIYYDIVTTHFVSEPPVIYCVARFDDLAKSYYYTSMFVVGLYWISFVIGLFCCQKIFTVQSMFTLQFAYISLIPVGVYCPPFKSLQVLKYCFGWNEIPFQVIQTHINIFYTSLGFKSNFISNVNVMVLPLAICPIIFVILTKIGQINQHYRTKPRLLVYGKTFLLQVPFTILLFNAPNICISFIISIQAFGLSNLPSLIMGLLMISLLILAGMLFTIFKDSFREYHKQFSTLSVMCCFDNDRSQKIRKYYPLILFFEIICISSVLATQFLIQLSLYITVGILVSITCCLFILAPYKKTFDNIRLFVHRLMLLIINCCQIGFKVLRNENAPQSSTIYVYPWFLLTVLILTISSQTLPYIIYKAVIWCRSKSLIDVALYNKQKVIKSRPYYPHVPLTPPLLYPALQFSRFPDIKKRDGHQQLSNIQQINPKNQEGGMVWHQNQIAE